jgi:hypothetical protein
VAEYITPARVLDRVVCALFFLFFPVQNRAVPDVQMKSFVHDYDDNFDDPKYCCWFSTSLGNWHYDLQNQGRLHSRVFSPFRKRRKEKVDVK